MRNRTVLSVLFACAWPVAGASPVPSFDNGWRNGDAERIVTATREKVCLNGLWAFQPESTPSPTGAVFSAESPSVYLKLPSTADAALFSTYGAEGQPVASKAFRWWKGTSAWFARKVAVPESWRGKRIVIGAEWINVALLVYVDGRPRGEAFFPGGAVTLDEDLAPGEHEIALRVFASIPNDCQSLFADREEAADYAAKNGRRGRAYVSGDVWIAAEDPAACVTDVLAMPSVLDGRLDFSVGLRRPAARKGRPFALQADVRRTDDPEGRIVKSFRSPPLDGTSDRVTFGGAWRDPRLWTPDEPTNLYAVTVSVREDGRLVDEAYPETFGFREVRVRGRDLLFNGHPLHIRMGKTNLPGSAGYTAEEIRETCRGLRAQGFSTLFSMANYGFEPGRMPSVEQVVREASRAGMCFVVALPEPGRFGDLHQPTNWVFDVRLRRRQEGVIRRLQNIPGLILWCGTVNHGYYRGSSDPLAATGRPEDVPENFVGAATFSAGADDTNGVRQSEWIRGVREKIREQNAFIRAADPSREVYNHAGGTVPDGSFYAINNYLDFAPVQERSDWFEHWQTNGVAPLMLVEYGSPHLGSWSNFRGGPGERVHMLGDRKKTKQCWMNEFNAQFLGERAFASSSAKRRLMDGERKFLKGNRPVFYYDYHHGPSLALMAEDDFHAVVADYLRRNLRDFRARGVASTLVWDFDRANYFTNNPALPRPPEIRADALEGLARFGVMKSDRRRSLPDRVTMLPNASGQAMIAAQHPLLGWIAGAGTDFTMADNVFRAGEAVRKSLIVLNDTFAAKTVRWSWSCGEAHGEGEVEVLPGGRADIPVAFALPAELPPPTRDVTIRAAFATADGAWRQEDEFPIVVLGAKREIDTGGVCIVGRNSLRPSRAGDPSPLARLRELMAKHDSVVVLEQDAATMAALGFRINEYGLRNAFALSPEFDETLLRDWRGASTLLPWFLPDDGRRRAGFARWNWQGFDNTRCWRAGNRGTVCSVLIEKPTVGDFRPLVQGGFDLQYAPVLEYRHGRKRILFSQLDIGGRTASACPPAEEAYARLIALARRPVAVPRYKRVRVAEGGSRVADELTSLGIAFAPVPADGTEPVPPVEILVVGPGAKIGSLNDYVAGGGTVLALGLSGDEANAILSGCGARTCTTNEYPEFNRQLATGSPIFAGISNADLQWRYSDDVAGLARFGDDLLRIVQIGKGVVVFAAPMPWNFDPDELAQRVNRRRAHGFVSRLLANLGAELPEVFSASSPKLYADEPIADDDPYRYFQW